MKNIVDERPDAKLTGRLRFSADFVSREDIENKKILDVGCGYGWFEEFCIKKGVDEITGTEITESDLKTARKYIKNKKIKFLVSGALKLPPKKNYFDTVVSWEVLEHIPKNTENKMFKEVYRVLKTNGVFYISTPNNAILSKYLDPAYWLIGHRHYDIEKLIELGSKNNFVVDKFIITGGIWTSISVINMYISKWIFRREPFLNKFINKKVTREYGDSGFYNIFIKFRKI